MTLDYEDQNIIFHLLKYMCKYLYQFLSLSFSQKEEEEEEKKKKLLSLSKNRILGYIKMRKHWVRSWRKSIHTSSFINV